MIERIPISVLRNLVTVFPFSVARLGRAYFKTTRPDAYVSVRMFDYDLPVRVARSDTHRLVCLEGEGFVPEARLVRRLVRPGDTVVDVGANIGYYALLLRRLVGPTGQVICIEPEPSNLDDLRRSLDVNGFDNVQVLPAAASDRKGELSLEPGMNGHVLPSGSGNAVAVRSILLDELADHEPSFVKMDIEGYELTALQGAEELISRLRPRLLIEVHPDLLAQYGASVAKVIEFVGSYYGRLTFYESTPRRPFLPYAYSRYVSSSRLRTAGTVDQVLAREKRGELGPPIWLTCSST